jgi:hypothetical protein
MDKTLMTRMIAAGNLNKSRETSDKARYRGKIKPFIKPAMIYGTVLEISDGYGL